MTTFIELQIGDTFDFVGPDRMLNSYYDRCVKISPRKYRAIDGRSKDCEMRVGSVHCEIFNVERNA